MGTARRFTAVLLASLLLASCGQSQPQDSNASADDVREAPDTAPEGAGPSAATAATGALLAGLQDGWNVLEPGADTICSDGSPYRFFVRRGHLEKLVVYFQGGGACWFGGNCDPHLDPSYKPAVVENEIDNYRGIFEFDHPENPFADYSFVVAPYCTGDVHLGNNVATYQAPAGEEHEPHDVTIHHKGIVNAEAVLDWTYAHFLAPAEIFVTGSSAGAIPSPYYAWKLADHYPYARVAQLGDGAGGYRRNPEVTTDRLEKWGTLEHLDQYEEFAAMTESEFNYEALYIAAAKRHPDITFAEYDAAEDATQKRFLAMGGNETTTLRNLLLANHADIRAEVDNFRAYIAGGDSHTVLARPEFYTFQVNGRRIRDWVADLAGFKEVSDVACEQCKTPELVEMPNNGGQ